jgi:hypothetical protein
MSYITVDIDGWSFVSEFWRSGLQSIGNVGVKAIDSQ